MTIRTWQERVNKAPVRWLIAATCSMAILGPPLRVARGVEPGRPRDILSQPADWWHSTAARSAADNILSWQTEAGGWPKNVDTLAPRPASQRLPRATFDNGATTDELRVLARMANATGDDQYRQGFQRGLDYILAAQYAHGGWPQYGPLPQGYSRHITFNDNAMVRLLEFVREVSSGDDYGFVSLQKRQQAQAAFAQGIDCILKCQVRVQGELTVWCAQHDEADFQPRPARAYELASLSGAESAGILRLLMSIDSPSPELIAAVEAGCNWLEKVKLSGVRLEPIEDPALPEGRDRRLVEDPNAPPLWARFYEIGTNRPMYVDRDGVVKYSLAEIGHERRNGYSWLSAMPGKVLERDYPAWRSKWRR